MEKNTNTDNRLFSLLKLIFTICAIIVLRLFLENFAYAWNDGYFFTMERFLHAITYFPALYLSLVLTVYLFAKEPIEKIFNFMIKVYLLILAVPVVDAIFNTFTQKADMAYLIISKDKILLDFFALFNPLSRQGVTLGQYFAAFVILPCMTYFVYKNRVNKRILYSILVFFTGYTVLFLYETPPSFLVYFTSHQISNDSNAINIYHASLSQSWLSYYTQALSSLNKVLFQIELAHEIIMAKFYFIVLFIESAFIFYLFNKKAKYFVLQDLRLERIVYWFLIAFMGMVINQKIFGNTNFFNPVNFISLITFLLLIALNIWLAVCINDSQDIEIDAVSNPNRALVAKRITLSDWNTLQIVLILMIASGLALTNRASTILIVLTQSIYYIYSVYPLRLKYNFLNSSIISGLGALSICMAGFFLISPDQRFSAFPLSYIFIIWIFFGLISNFKDIKDFVGDSQAKIKTMPVFFGLNRAKYIISVITSLTMISLASFFKEKYLLVFSIFVAAFLSYIFIKKEYQEKHVFLILFIYAVGFYSITR